MNIDQLHLEGGRRGREEKEGGEGGRRRRKDREGGREGGRRGRGERTCNWLHERGIQ